MSNFYKTWLRILTGVGFSFLFHTAFVWHYVLMQELPIKAIPALLYFPTLLMAFIGGFWIAKYIRMPWIPISFYLVTDWGIKIYMKELIRPWKLATLVLGISGLIIGSYLVKLPDWDTGISILMAILAYIFASWSSALLLSSIHLKKKRIISTFSFLFFYWITVDGSYVIYNEIKGTMYFRLSNFLASSLLYFICAGLWMYRGELKSLKV